MIVYKVFLENGTWIGSFPERRKRSLTQQDYKRGIEVALDFFKPFVEKGIKLKFRICEYKENR